MTTPTQLTELLALIELSEKATPGPWRWSCNGNIMAPGDREVDEIAAVYTEYEDDRCPANAELIIAAVNFIREHGKTLVESLAAHRGEVADGDLTLLDRVEFALRDAGFDYDEAFRCAYLAEYGIDPRSHPPQAQAGAGDYRPHLDAIRSLVSPLQWETICDVFREQDGIIRAQRDKIAALEAKS